MSGKPHLPPLLPPSPRLTGKVSATRSPDIIPTTLSQRLGGTNSFLKKKYGWIRSSNAGTKRKKDVHVERHIAEYMLYTNAGRVMTDIMAAYKHRYKVDCQKFDF